MENASSLPESFFLPFGPHRLYGDRYGSDCSTLVMHGAGNSSMDRFLRLRQALNGRGMPSVSFDFIGHGRTRGSLTGSSLRQRTDQAEAVIRETLTPPLTLIGASMSGYTAIQLTCRFEVENLILLVPAVYTPEAYDLSFGPGFSAVIRKPVSWQISDAFHILSGFRGKLLIIAAEHDLVIPRAVVEKIHASATKAISRELWIIPGAGHLSLFSNDRDFFLALEKIAALHKKGEKA